MAEKAPWPLNKNIQIDSIAHKASAGVTVTMDNSVFKHADSDYDWVGTYGVHNLADVPTPAPYHGHKGTDIALGLGSPIYAISAGKVTVSGGTFNEVYIDTGEITDCYLHMDIGYVQVGQSMKAGQLIGKENGWGASGPSTYGSHLHLDRYINAYGRGPGTIDSFLYAQGVGTPIPEEEIRILVDNIGNWDPNNGKIGIWVGGGVRVHQGAVIHAGPNSGQIWMEQANGNGVPLTVWKTECGVTMEAIVGNIVGNRCQVGVYDQLGAFHPRAWIDITKINW